MWPWGPEGKGYVLLKRSPGKASPRLNKTYKNKSKKKMSGAKRYEIHDNFGRPFLVDDFGDRVVVYSQTFNMNTDTYDEPVKLFDKKYKKLFVGDKPMWQVTENWAPGFKGNSLLLEVSDNTYMHIGTEIYEFNPVSGDKIVEYWSEVGNNDVPYPYAVGKTHLYFLIDGEHKSVPIDYFNLNEDIYKQYYLSHHVNLCKNKVWSTNELCKRLKDKDQDLKDQLEFLEKHRKPFKVTMIKKREW